MAKDVKMSYIEDDINKIQLKTNMYLKNYGEQGALHLVLEVVQNSIDECCDVNSPGSTIDITYDNKTGIMTVDDNGRGFPENDYPLEIFCTKIQSGSKFYRDQGGSSAGEFGLGLTAVNALSDIFVLESRRQSEGYLHRIEFERGVKISDTKEKLKKGDKKHGCFVKFKPSPMFLGNGTKIPYENFKKWCEDISYLINPDNKIKMTVTLLDGLNVIETNKFKPREFSSFFDDKEALKANRITDDVFVSGTESWVETVNDVQAMLKTGKTKTNNINRELQMDVVFAYDNTSEPCKVDSFCNFANTTNGGIHVKAFDEAYCQLMMNKVNATLSDSQKDKLGIKWDDIRTGLNVAINLSTNAEVGFIGNAKDAIGNEKLKAPIKRIIRSKLEEILDNDKSLLNSLLKVIKDNAKARNAALNSRIKTGSSTRDNFEEYLMKKYFPCTNDRKDQFKELFLVEGDSASGSVTNARDPKSQAVFLFRGVTANPIKVDLVTLLKNKEWENLTKRLGCGIGVNCNPDNLLFDRINIFTDSDVDGSYITSEILAFFYTHMRPLIEQGKLYKVLAPLYELNSKTQKFAVSKKELVERFRKKIAKNYKVGLATEEDFFNKDELMIFLEDIYDYSSRLSKTAGLLGDLPVLLVERVAALFTMFFVHEHHKTPSAKSATALKHQLDNQKFIKSLMKAVQEKYPEMILEGENIQGGVGNHYRTMMLDERSIRYMGHLMPTYAKYGYLLKIKDKSTGDVTIKTIQEFLDLVSKFNVEIVTRFKGLGECNKEDLYDTVMDINRRTSVQYTVEGTEKELEIFNMLHNDSKKDSMARKEFMRNATISPEDFDN